MWRRDFAAGRRKRNRPCESRTVSDGVASRSASIGHLATSTEAVVVEMWKCSHLAKKW